MTVGSDSGGGGAGGVTSGKKRQRSGSYSRLSSTIGIIDSSRPDNTLTERSQKTSGIRRTASHDVIAPSSSAAASGGFNDSATADVVLRLFVDQLPLFDTDDSESISAVDSDQSDVQIYLHSDVLRRSKYFAALLSDRWQKESNDVDSGNSSRMFRLNLGVPATPGSIDHHLAVLQLLYTSDFSTTIHNVSVALCLLSVALELIFEDCIKACVRFLEAVPWTEDEERKILSIVPLLGKEESQELLARVSIDKIDSSEQMLHGLILSALHNHPNMAFAKAFVAKLLRDFSSKDAAKRVLDGAFQSSLKIVKESLEEYSSPDFRGDHNEIEAIQRLNLHTAMTNGRHLLWLVERMIELRVADTAVQEWSNQAAFTADLLRALRDDAWRNIVPGLPAVVLRCTCKLSNAVATGTILATRQFAGNILIEVSQKNKEVGGRISSKNVGILRPRGAMVRKKIVKDWLPVLILCKDYVTPMMPSHKTIYVELEDTFLRIISTLPLSDAQELLQQCLSFSTRNVDDCPHLISAFTTWFRRVNRFPLPDM